MSASPRYPDLLGFSGRADPFSNERARQGVVASIGAHPVLIPFVTLVTVLAAFFGVSARGATYEASAEVLVTPIPEGESLPQLPLLRASSDRTRVIQTAARLLDSRAAASLAAERLGQDWTADHVDAMVAVLPDGETDVLAVTARADDPQLAARVANEFARAALETRGRALAPIIAKRAVEIETELRAQRDPSSPVALDLAERLATVRALRAADGDPTLSLTRRADAPASPIGLPRSLIMLVSVLAGIAVAIGAALLIDMLTPVRIADDAEAVAATGLPILARVPELGLRERALRAPVRFRPAAAAPLRMLQHQLVLATGTPCRLLVVGASAGDGVTTSVAELGLTLARAGHQVLVVDLHTGDPELAARLGVSELTTLSELAAADENWESGIAPVPGAPGLSVVAIGAQGSLGIPDDVAAELPRLLAAARERFDYVLVDAPPLAETGEAVRIASGVDAAVLVVRPRKTPIAALETALDILERAQLRPEGLLIVGGRAAAAVAEPPRRNVTTGDAPRALSRGLQHTIEHELALVAGTPRRLLFVGESARDGVTTSVAELGLTLARAGHQVLVVDLHTGDPELAARLGVSELTTLSELAAADENWESGIAPVPGAPGLSVVAIGAQGSPGIPDDVAAELPRLLAAARERFDYVLVDAPPLAETGEAVRIASGVDAAVLVVRPGTTPSTDVEAALDVLEQAQLRPNRMLLVGERAPTPSAEPAAGDPGGAFGRVPGPP